MIPSSPPPAVLLCLNLSSITPVRDQLPPATVSPPDAEAWASQAFMQPLSFSEALLTVRLQCHAQTSSRKLCQHLLIPGTWMGLLTPLPTSLPFLKPPSRDPNAWFHCETSCKGLIQVLRAFH